MKNIEESAFNFNFIFYGKMNKVFEKDYVIHASEWYLRNEP